MTPEPPPGSFATLTHARLRAEQGDVEAALRILRVILEIEPGHTEARRLADELQAAAAGPRPEPPEPAEPSRAPARAEDLAPIFSAAMGKHPAPSRSVRAQRLSEWLVAIVARRGERRVR